MLRGGESPQEPVARANPSRIRSQCHQQGWECLGRPHPQGPEHDDLPPPRPCQPPSISVREVAPAGADSHQGLKSEGSPCGLCTNGGDSVLWCLTTPLSSLSVDMQWHGPGRFPDVAKSG